MIRQVNGTIRNAIVYTLLVITIAGIIYGVIRSNTQDEGFLQNAQQYQNALANMQSSKFNQTEKDFKQLLVTHPNSYVLMWNCALSLAKQDKYDEAAQYFVKTQKQHPFIVQNPQYLVHYGETLYKQGEYEKATRYLQEAKRLKARPELMQQAELMLSDIEKKRS